MNQDINLEPETDLGYDEVLLDPIRHTGPKFYFTIAVLGSLSMLGLYAYYIQFREGLGVTGMNRPVYWGVYITNFVFFIGISHAGTLISAILRLTRAEWRRAITRSAEVITVMVLFFGVANILMDLGRPDRMLNMVFYGQFGSPLLWDMTAISVYLTGSIIFLFMPLIPDIAIIRDHYPEGRLHFFYRILSFGWVGTERQHKILKTAIAVMSILIIPIAVSVHTVVSFVFAMTVQPMWHSAIFGPYFVVGAIFSGIAALILAMAIIRWVYKLDGYLKDIHFNNLGLLLLVFVMLWVYFTGSEYLTTFYGAEPTHMAVWNSKVLWSGDFALLFWSMIVFCFVIPFALLCNTRTRTIKGTVIASIFVIIGMWLERYVIVVPSLSNPRLPIERGIYSPAWVEWSILVGCFSCFILLYVLFTKFFPIVSIWEIREGRELSVKEVSERVESYLPPDDNSAQGEGNA